ncbi:PDZ serine protease [Bacillus sp. FJAT-27225]|uniref:PDZ domain-containing protein n=1 Tax=Bacillus sp. FJAT-27225 TaxID=1743144 RepID=UPI00080C2BEF|nr:PDZ domain-containing protein [Bacillus sp. FJAT-27225]OCA88232.1 PDZ serine protease [Bacillus sp. FJAT-27225]
MIEQWGFEVIKGIGRMFLHPVFYYVFFLAAVLGVSRVKRERKNFHIRARDAYFELRQLVPAGLAVGLVLSVAAIASGLAVPVAALILIAGFTLLFSLTGNMRLIGPAYTIGAAFFALAILGGVSVNFPVVQAAFEAAGDKLYPSVAILLALLVIAEGVLILKRGSFATSPKLKTSKRGQRVGVHEARKLWLVPVFLLIPGSALSLPVDWWPVFTLGAETYSLFLVPFAVGMHQQVFGMHPVEAIQSQGKKVITLGMFVLVIAAAGYWYPIAAVGASALAILGREALALFQKLKEDGRPFYFSRRNNGLMILGIIPGSPAEKMGLKVGELVSKVNGMPVHDEQEFYEALQHNRAQCRLEVFDTNNQVRFAQRALYEGDHHELGILFVHDEKKWDDKAVSV